MGCPGVTLYGETESAEQSAVPVFCNFKIPICGLRATVSSFYSVFSKLILEDGECLTGLFMLNLASNLF